MITIDEVKRLKENNSGGEYWEASASDINNPKDDNWEVINHCEYEGNSGYGFIAEFLSKGDAQFIAKAPDIVNLAIQLSEDNEKLRNALLWARPYVSRLRDTEIIDLILNHKEK